MSRRLGRIPSRIAVLSTGIVVLAAARPAAAQGSWTDWTAATTGASGSATGTLVFGGADVLVTYAGEVLGAQTSCGVNYWTTPTTYDAPGISAPPACDIVRLVGGNQIVNTITFSQPVSNPFMAILSLGQPSSLVSYDFSAPFDVVSSGPGFWGNGPLTELAGDRLQGQEGHGTIQFSGTFTSISWTVPNAENWHGFTVGAAGLGNGVAVVPEPGTVALTGIGLAGLGLLARRRLGSRG